jgi:hypothetical protein
MSTRPDMVSTEIELRLVVSDGPDRAVQADLSYAPTDPYAVRVAFHTGSTETVEWTFARSLLTYSHVPTGCESDFVDVGVELDSLLNGDF